MKPETTEETKKRRNSKTVGFSDEEYAEIVAMAKKMNLYPRQAIMAKVRSK